MSTHDLSRDSSHGDTHDTLQGLIDGFLDYRPFLDWRDKAALEKIKELLPDCEAIQFTARALMNFQRTLIKQDYARRYINKLVGLVRRVVNWAIRADILPDDFGYKLSRVPPLKYGEARETKRRKDAKVDEIIAILPHLSETAGDMLLLQYLTGMRPSEVCNIKEEEIDKSGDVWRYIPAQHKTAGKGKIREFVFCETAQKILNKYPNTHGCQHAASAAPAIRYG